MAAESVKALAPRAPNMVRSPSTVTAMKIKPVLTLESTWTSWQSTPLLFKSSRTLLARVSFPMRPIKPTFISILARAIAVFTADPPVCIWMEVATASCPGIGKAGIVRLTSTLISPITMISGITPTPHGYNCSG